MKHISKMTSKLRTMREVTKSGIRSTVGEKREPKLRKKIPGWNRWQDRKARSGIEGQS